MKRLLCIVSSMDRGGAETFLMKIYRTIDRSKYQFDFCVNKSGGFYDDEIKKMGGKIYVVPKKSSNPFKCYKTIKKIVKNNGYKYVLRTSQQSLATVDLIAAKRGGAKVLVYRSSNAGMTGGLLKRVINKIFSFLPKIIPNVRIAPSIKAAEYVFGKRAVNRKEVSILNNGLDYNVFKFSDKTRNKIRKELQINDDTILYGHVGRFNQQKNHTFLIDIYKEVLKTNVNSRLLLIGDGEEKNKIIAKIKDMQLSNNVIILEPKSNIQDYFMAMDLLIFPSFFEGMPNVIIEAQATGLRCILSDTITREADITGLLDYYSILKSKEEWAEKIVSYDVLRRVDTYDCFKKNGYLIDHVAKCFIEEVFEKKN